MATDYQRGDDAPSTRIRTSIAPACALGAPMNLNTPPPPSPTAGLRPLEMEVMHALDSAKLGWHHVKTVVISGKGGHGGGG